MSYPESPEIKALCCLGSEGAKDCDGERFQTSEVPLKCLWLVTTLIIRTPRRVRCSLS